MNSLSIDSRIIFSSQELKKWEVYSVRNPQIITLISWKIKEATSQLLSTFESSAYYQWNTLTALEDTLLSVFEISQPEIILNKVDIDKEFWEFCRKNWKQLRELRDVPWFEKVDLYRWDQIDLEYKWVKYKLNLWFCGKEVDCLFHNQHNFIEVHTNIAGDGYMQKSLDGTDAWLCETVWLLPWNSHRKFNKVWEFEGNVNPIYPMHRWLWGTTWNIWLVIEQYNNF